jgi:hypothetical protein
MPHFFLLTMGVVRGLWHMSVIASDCTLLVVTRCRRSLLIIGV